jgi:hypothetical protein
VPLRAGVGRPVLAVAGVVSGDPVVACFCCEMTD